MLIIKINEIFTNRIWNDHTSDQRRKYATYISGTICKSHEIPSEIWTEIHVIDIVTAISGDVGGNSDD